MNELFVFVIQWTPRLPEIFAWIVGIFWTGRRLKEKDRRNTFAFFGFTILLIGSLSLEYVRQLVRSRVFALPSGGFGTALIHYLAEIGTFDTIAVFLGTSFILLAIFAVKEHSHS
jgi:hypothetical protein